MALSFTPVSPDRLLPSLSESIAAVKRDTPLRPVSVIVSANAAGVAARRYLGRTTGIAAVDFITLDRLAEVIAGPTLALVRRPVSTPVIELAIRAVMASLSDSDDESNLFGPVARHASTVTALRELYRDVRGGGVGALKSLASGTVTARAAADVLGRVAERLAVDWYDQTDLYTTATDLLGTGAAPPTARNVIVFAPEPPGHVERELLRSLASAVDVEVLSNWTGRPHLDDEFAALVAMADNRASAAAGSTSDTEPRLGVDHRADTWPVSQQHTPQLRSTRVISVTDADEEVRLVAREIIESARRGVSFDRMAVLWPSGEPYARLVEHHLTRADIAWNGRPGIQIGERIVPRFLLDLLQLDRRGLRRTEVFELLSDINLKGRDAPTAEWERVARAAGVSEESDWKPRLTRYAERQRRYAAQSGADTSTNADNAEALLGFIEQLRRDLGRRRDTRTWTEWSDWARTQIGTRLGPDLLAGRVEAERLASDYTLRVLDRLGHLDTLGGGPVTRAEFRAVFAAEFDSAPGRQGNLGVGVTVGSIAGHHALDIDLAFIIGAAEGLLPPPPRTDPLITEADRTNAGLAPSDAITRRIERQYLTTLATVPSVTIVFPRGDLRGSLERFPSRWISSVTTETGPPDVSNLPSHHAALLATSFPVNSNEFRLRHFLAAAAAQPLDESAAAGDPSLLAALEMRAARRSNIVTIYDGDLSGTSVPPLTDPVSPSRIQAWPACPQAYFQHYLLEVRQVDDPGLELTISAAERGNVLHRTLDLLHREVIDGQLPQPTGGWTALHVERGRELFDTVADDFEASGRTGRPAAWSIERRALLNELLGWFEADSARLTATRATIVSSEARFGGDGTATIAIAGGRELLVHGSIDRIDQLGDGRLKVVDHKTGRPADYKRLSGDDPTDGGRAFQLPIYAAGARAITGQPGAPVTAAYSMMSAGGFNEYGYTFTPTVDDRVGAALGRVVGGIEAGFFPSTPDAPGFQLFVKCAYCDPDGLGTAAAYEQFANKLADPRFERWLVSGPDERAQAAAP